MRLFIALDLEPLRHDLDIIRSQIPLQDNKIKLVDSYHLTLKFLGEVKNLQDIIQRLKTIRFNELDLEMAKIGIFPNKNYIKIIWLGIKHNKDLLKLQKEIAAALPEFKEKKAFHPHITLARARYIKDKENLKETIKQIATPKKTVHIDNFKLIKSTLTSKGPVYETIETFLNQT